MRRHKITDSIRDIDKFIDLSDDEIRNLYFGWDKGDCSVVGLLKILLIQEIKHEIKERDVHYCGEHDELLNALSKSPA